jgi:hypothetical protein
MESAVSQNGPGPKIAGGRVFPGEGTMDGQAVVASAVRRLIVIPTVYAY